MATFDLEILLEPNYKEIIKENYEEFNKEYEMLKKDYEKYKNINPDLMKLVILNYIYYKSYEIIDHYYKTNLDHFIDIEDDFKFKSKLYEEQNADSHRLFIMYLDSVELLFQLILAHTVVNRIYTLEPSIITKIKKDYDPKNMFDSFKVGLKYKDLVKEWCKKDNYKELKVCEKSYYPSKIRQLKLFYKDKITEIERINNKYSILFNLLYLNNKYKNIICNINELLKEEKGTIIPTIHKINYFYNELTIEINIDDIPIYSNKLTEFVKNCVNNKKFIIIYIVIIYSNVKGHANMLIYNPNYREIQVFEPLGTKIHNDVFKTVVNKLFPRDVKYLDQSNFDKRFQKESKEYLPKESGHCATWSIWYADKILSEKYRNLPIIEAYNQIYKELDTNDFSKTMRDYIDFIKMQRETVLNKIETNDTIKRLLKEYWGISEPITNQEKEFKSRISIGSSRIRERSEFKNISEKEIQKIEQDNKKKQERIGKMKVGKPPALVKKK